MSNSFISIIVSQRWCSNTTRQDIDRPMAWAVVLVARRARSIALLRFLSEAASRPASSLASILAWKTWTHSHRVQRRSRLSSCRVCASSECRSGSAWLERMIHPRLPSDSCGRAKMRAPRPLWVWRCMKRMAARCRGQSKSPITLPCPKPPEKGCHPCRHHSHRTRSCRSQPQRDADHVEWRGPANTLPAVTARHAGFAKANMR